MGVSIKNLKHHNISRRLNARFQFGWIVGLLLQRSSFMISTGTKGTDAFALKI